MDGCVGPVHPGINKGYIEITKKDILHLHEIQFISVLSQFIVVFTFSTADNCLKTSGPHQYKCAEIKNSLKNLRIENKLLFT